MRTVPINHFSLAAAFSEGNKRSLLRALDRAVPDPNGEDDPKDFSPVSALLEHFVRETLADVLLEQKRCQHLAV